MDTPNKFELKCFENMLKQIVFLKDVKNMVAIFEK